MQEGYKMDGLNSEETSNTIIVFDIIYIIRHYNLKLINPTTLLESSKPSSFL